MTTLHFQKDWKGIHRHQLAHEQSTRITRTYAVPRGGDSKQRQPWCRLAGVGSYRTGSCSFRSPAWRHRANCRRERLRGRNGAAVPHIHALPRLAEESCQARMTGFRPRGDLPPDRRHVYAVYPRCPPRSVGLDAVRARVGVGPCRCGTCGGRGRAVSETLDGPVSGHGLAHPHSGKAVVAPRAVVGSVLAIDGWYRIYGGCGVLCGQAGLLRPLRLAPVRHDGHRVSFHRSASVRGLTAGVTSIGLSASLPTGPITGGRAYSGRELYISRESEGGGRDRNRRRPAWKP